MSDKPQIDLSDTEYTTPQQAAEIRRMKAELPLWQEMEAMIEVTGGNEELDAMLEATRAEMAVVASMHGLPVDVVVHRAINGTTGMESEE